jgi:hypothetical protein
MSHIVYALAFRHVYIYCSVGFMWGNVFWCLLPLRLLLTAWREAAVAARGRRAQRALELTRQLRWPWLSAWGEEAVYAADYICRLRGFPMARLLLEQWYLLTRVCVYYRHERRLKAQRLALRLLQRFAALGRSRFLICIWGSL